MTTDINTLPEHLHKPHLRPVQLIPVKNKEGKQFVALRDPSMLSQQQMVVPVQVVPVLQQLRGERSLDELIAQFKGEPGQFLEMVQGLDKLGLLWGPTFEQMEAQLREKLHRMGHFPVRMSGTLGKDAAACRAAIDAWFEQTEDPEVEGTVIGLIAPHLDYSRGWPNYAGAYHTIRQMEVPDRVVILGTNHFGSGDGAVLAPIGFASPLGVCPVDKSIVDPIIARLGRPIVVDELDHMAEHSIELHVPWIQHCWGNVPVVAALVPDPVTEPAAADAERVNSASFIAALGDALRNAGGTSFFVASSDLSHVGPQFGEPRPVDDQRRFDVERHDREMMAKFIAGDADEFVAAMKWNKNPTRWCSVGNMAAVLQLAAPGNIELIDYRQAYDDSGAVLVSSASMALLA